MVNETIAVSEKSFIAPGTYLPVLTWGFDWRVGSVWFPSKANVSGSVSLTIKQNDADGTVRVSVYQRYLSQMLVGGVNSEFTPFKAKAGAKYHLEVIVKAGYCSRTSVTSPAVTFVRIG